MNTIIKLSNRVRVVIIGSCNKLIFDDNTIVRRWAHSEYNLTMITRSFNCVQRNGRSLIIHDYGKLELNKWVTNEIDEFAELYNAGEIDIIMCNPDIVHFVWEYMKLFKIPIYCPNIIDWEEDTPIASINTFLEYNPDYV